MSTQTDPSSAQAQAQVLARRIAGASARLLDLILPQTTLAGAPAQSGGLPAGAWQGIEFLADPVCDGCGSPFPYDPGPAVRCPACMARPRAFARARAACLYDEASRGPILMFKHGDRTDLAVLFSRWLERAAGELLAEADAVVPVPLHRWRLLRRRYNQAAELARPLARRAGLAYLPDVLVRERATDTQGGKSAVGRRRNVAGAFDVPDSKRAQVEGRRILLIDDVLTTGATAHGCARALLAAGAAQVDLAVIAKVRAATDTTI
ncbi:ComF family protein [Caulobacter ginsengisoli]|uniref:ComF family protein n=1 Tax=Caulobacter ginsengisoli TaxID=400775 RepID=A0ABU0IR13_9CAUL|nr:ComF family protein [Caulobacter ginsengisoli]